MAKKKSKSIDIVEALQAIHYMYEKKMDGAFSKFNLSNEQFRILKILEAASAEGMSLKEIQAELPNQTANTTRLVEKLRIKGYLTKKSAKADKRRLVIALTESGTKSLQDARAEIKQVDKLLKKSIKSKNTKVFFGELKRLKSALK